MKRLKILGSITLCVVLCGCKMLGLRSDPAPVFPRLDSAQAQFFYAADIDENTLHGRPGRETDLRMEHVIAAYEEVLTHFAEDQFFTPLALTGIGNCHYEAGHYQKVIEVFERAKKEYPRYPFVHATAEWRIAESLEKLGRHREAKDHFQRCINTFEHNENTRIQAIVKDCKAKWIQPSIPEQ